MAKNKNNNYHRPESISMTVNWDQQRSIIKQKKILSFITSSGMILCI